MSRPVDGYKIDGEKVPGVTTVISRWKESGGLVHWAWEQGRDGKDYRKTRDDAADAGTCAHDMMEADIYGAAFDRSLYKPDILERSEGAFQGYMEWKRQTNLQVAEAECSLVSKVYRFGGTLDALFVQGKLACGDWKTSNRVYPDYLLQLAAYRILWEENHPDQPITGGFHLLRFSKQDRADDPISFTHHYWSDLTLAKEQFLDLLKCYERDKRLKKLI
jgi:hypothetical protein